MTGPLEGIRVVECGGYLSAPSAGYILGDLGAEVIKIEDRVKGDPVRGMSSTFGRGMIMPDGTNILFETANRNKKSVTLDLRKEKGKDLLYHLVAASDVFNTNYSLSAINELAIDYQTLKKYNPKLIYGLATGYGTQGPGTEKRAFDTIAQARSGIMYTVGDPDGPPLQIAGAVFDQVTGTLLVNGILAALIARDRQGIGQQVDVSLLGSGIHLQAYNINVALLRGRPMPRPSRKTLKNPLANHYQCADSKWLLLSEAQSDRFWHSFCLALGIEELEKDARFATTKDRRDNFLELTGIRAGDLVAVTGPGPIGLLALQIATGEGGRIVMIGTGKDKSRLEIAKSLGADITINISDENACDRILGISGGMGADVVLECSGAPEAAALGLELVRKQGKYTQIGLFGRPFSVDFEKIAYKEIQLTGSLSQHCVSWKRALALMAAGKVRLKPLISDVIPLNQWKRGFDKIEAGEGVKILLDPKSAGSA